MKPNKTHTLDITFIQDSNISNDRNFVRTGTYGDGNCFFHAVLRAIDIQYRKQTTHYGHLKIVEKFRKDLSEWITTEVFQKLGDGEQLRLYFLTEFNSLLEKDTKQDPVLTIVNTLLPYSVIEKEIIPQILNKQSENFYKLFCWECEKYIHNKLDGHSDSQKINMICTHMRNHFINLFKKAHANALTNFKLKMSTMGEYVDSFQMECISLYTGYNFLFIDESKDNSYVGISHVVNFDSNRKSLVFLWVDGNHFEIVGELENKNMINRIFASDDPFIKSLSEKYINS